MSTNLSSIGRFSSQMLTYLGTQRTVELVTGNLANTFKYSTGTPVYPNPGSLSQSALGAGVTGNYSSESYNSTKCYFLSRGASIVYADAMTGLTIDMASILNISPASLLNKVDINNTMLFDSSAFRTFNMLRDSGNQVGTATTVSNKNSLQSRQIRS